MFKTLTVINTNAGTNGGSDFIINNYWSSTEYNNNTVWFQNFGTGFQNILLKTNTYRASAVRAF